MLKAKHLLYGLAIAGLLSSGAVMAQNTNSADLTGSVTDISGGLIPGATVTVKDVDKGTERTFTTDKAGLYDTGSIVPDHYLVTITAKGFKTLVRGPVDLDVGTHTLNAQLPIGDIQQQVVVTTDLPLLDTSDGSQTDTLSAKTMAQLPQYGADWENFVQLLPGSSFSYRAGQSTSINGNLPYSSILADGATTTLPMSTNADVTIFETTAEVKVDTNAFSAQYGLGGIIFNQITKGGTDHFHGSAYEYFQNNALNAADYAFGQGGAPGFQRYDNYGFSVGGPVPLPYFKHKLFFYFDYDKTYSNGGSGNQFLTVPTDAEKAGDFTGMPTIYDYNTQVLSYNSSGVASVTRESFANEYGNGNKIPVGYAGLSTVAAAAQKYFPEPNVTTGTITTSLGLPYNNYFTNVPNLAPFTKYFGRLDYSPVQSHRFTISETESDNPAVSYGNGKQLCPINCQYQDVSRDNAQVSDVWTISSNMVNEARFGFTDQLNFFSPFTQGKNFPQQLGAQWTVANAFPNFSWNNYLGLGSPTNAVYKEFVFDPSDVFTLIHGRHVLHFGGEVLINRADSTAWGNQNPASINFQGYYTDYALNQQVPSGTPSPQSTDPTDYADFLLGYSADWYGQNDPEFGARMKNPQAFIQDDIKLRPNLTVNVGLRWYGTTGFSEVHGNIAAFDPTIVNPGTDPNGNVNTLGAAWYEYSHANGRTHLQAPVWDTFLPRFGFSYSKDPKTVVRGGIGLYNYTWSEDTYGAGMGNALGLNTGEFDNSGGIYPVLLLDSDGSTNYQQGYGVSVQNLEARSNPTGPAGYNGTGMSYNMYHTPVPKIWQYNLTLQRELGTTMMAQVAYVGSKGWNLNFPVDINQVPENKLSATDTTPGTNERPYPNFTGLGGSTNNASSNYNSLQVVFQKRLAHGLQFTANYTWSKFLDSQDSSGWGSSAGSQGYQNSYCVKCNWGPSNFDVRHVFTFQGIYTLPFGRGAMFLNKSYAEDLILGGWRLAATSRENTGSPFTPTMSSNQTNAQAGNQYPNLIGNPLSSVAPGEAANSPSYGGQQLHVHTIQNWFNKYAYAAPGQYVYGNVRRNSLYGPDYSDLDLSFGKTFDIYKNYKLEIRADAQNALNHASFSAPDSGIGDSNPAVITGVTNGGRHIQLYGKFTF
ncbi:MAG: carboxypeptidase-like regulatory domain-containing protein [Acidobacteriaceae bacterium]